MCEARVYVQGDGAVHEVMHDVVGIEYDAETGTFMLSSLLGERKLVRGRVTRLDFLKHTVLIEPVEAETGPIPPC
jgi:predicted RNA-binding protein